MLRRIVELFNPSTGMKRNEEPLSQAANGQLGNDEASNQIRRPATEVLFPLWLPGLFRLVGDATAVSGICFGSYNVVFAIGTDEAPGVVIKMNDGSPAVDFKVGDKLYSFQSPFPPKPPHYQIGDPVRVLYHPSNPKSAQINSFVERWLLPIVFTSIDILTVILSYLVPRFTFGVH